eukprot:TRINITY_DN49319_c0_g1_i1.p1 TRINITY_DN49319_c0_g1~~TRINITY_DN49319_c0_g1_i1.p1  ORF type:complete len:559 (-),score=53.99 TRINITY_DN49319_c0_g1_i1:36-1712(-)
MQRRVVLWSFGTCVFTSLPFSTARDIFVSSSLSADDDAAVLRLGHDVVPRGRPVKDREATGKKHAERVFLDMGLCFNRSVSVTAVEFLLQDTAALHAGRLRWHVLRGIPSLAESPTQWFSMYEAWPATPKGEPASKAFPQKGPYHLELRPPLSLGFGDCVGWSIGGADTVPFAFDDEGAEVAWAESSDGLHDAVELFVKRGERPAPHIDWTGIISRMHSLRLLYQLREDRRALSQEDVPEEDPFLSRAHEIVEGGNPACWRGGFTFQQCCTQPHSGCWDAFFTFDRCCTLKAKKHFTEFDFHVPDPHGHYDLRHLSRGNAPRLGPLQDDEALLLFSLVRAMRPRTIVEFGTANGFSGMNWMHAIADEPDARVYSYDIVPYPAGTGLEDADPRFTFIQKSQADFDWSDVELRPVDVAFFDAGHLVEYSLKAFERVLPALTSTAMVAVHDTGLHVLDHGTGAPSDKEGAPFTMERCEALPGGASRCRRAVGCSEQRSKHGEYCVGRAHRPSERRFVREVLRRWPEFRPFHVHSTRVFRHGLTLLQRGTLWDPDDDPAGEF